MLRVVAASLAFAGLGLVPSTAFAQQAPAATQRALNLINDCAQARERQQQLPAACVTPSPTATPTPRPPVVVTATPAPVADAPDEAPLPTSVPARVCWLTDEQTGDPDNGHVVIVPYFWPDGSPALDEDGNQQYGGIEIPCDATPTPVPTPTPTDAPTALPAARAPAPAVVRPPAPPPAPVVAAPAPSNDAELAALRAEVAALQTREALGQVTATPTSTATSTPTATTTATPTATSSPTLAPTPRPGPTMAPVGKKRDDWFVEGWTLPEPPRPTLLQTWLERLSQSGLVLWLVDTDAQVDQVVSELLASYLGIPRPPDAGPPPGWHFGVVPHRDDQLIKGRLDGWISVPVRAWDESLIPVLPQDVREQLNTRVYDGGPSADDLRRFV